MSGKSTYMRQLALTIIMAQMGCFVPAERASLPIFDRLYTRIGAMDDLIGGQSTFMVEMTETNQAIANATRKSLLLFDEIGRGTATYDGMALAEAIIEHVHDEIKAKTLFSTHYHELTVLDERLPRLKNVHVGAVEEDGELVFLHQMLPGAADKSYGVQVAKLAGLPAPLLKRAENILKELEMKQEHMVEEEQPTHVVEEEKLNTTQKQLDLFEAPDKNVQDVIGKIEKMNILNTTPLDAIQILNELQQKLSDK